MRVITYATNKSHPYLAHLANKLQIEILKEYRPWRWDFSPRSYSARDFVSCLNPDELVLSVDAYDVFALNGCNKIEIQKKIKKCFDLDKVTFCAETNCFPNPDLADRYPKVNSDWKYLNAGIYVGKAKLVLQMLDLTVDKMVGSMDQLQFSELFLNSNLIDLDHECQIFQSLFRKESGQEICWKDYDIKNKMIMNKHFGTYPMLFHGNGKIKMQSLFPFLF
jgi:hypothetical protein